MSSTWAIRVAGVHKSFPQTTSWRDFFRPRERRPALIDVSFSLRPGRTLGVLGVTGAGKTTLLKILSTTVAPEQGSCEILGVDVLRDPNRAKHHLGLVVNEERSFYFRLTARQNLEFFAALWDLRGQERDRRIQDVLNLVGLADRADDRFDRFSTGMRQRMAIARGLLVDPDILLLDEPTRSLDPVASASIRRFVRDQLVVGRGKTAVLATNDLTEVEDLADDLLVLRAGSVLAHGPLEEIRTQWDGGLEGLVRAMAPDVEVPA